MLSVIRSNLRRGTCGIVNEECQGNEQDIESGAQHPEQSLAASEVAKSW